MAFVKISVIFIFTLFSYFSYSSTECAEVVDILDATESSSDVLNTARKVISKRKLSTNEEQTILQLRNFIARQSEPLTPKQIFDNVAFDLEQAGFNLYELWDIAHSNVLQMSFKDRGNFRKLLKGNFSNDELGLPADQSYPIKLKYGGSISHGSIVYAYHHSHSYADPDTTAVNNSHPILAVSSPLTHQRIFGWADFGHGYGYTVKGIKEPLERFITGRFLLGSSNRWNSHRRKRVYAVHFLYEGRIIKEYIPFFDADMQWVAFGFNDGDVIPVKRTRTTGKILPKSRRDIALLRYSLQRFKTARNENSLPTTLYENLNHWEAIKSHIPVRNFFPY